MAPEWTQVEFSVAVTLSGAACGQLAWRGCVWCGFARFGAKMAAAAQLQNDAGGGRGWRVAVFANLSGCRTGRWGKWLVTQLTGFSNLLPSPPQKSDRFFKSATLPTPKIWRVFQICYPPHPKKLEKGCLCFLCSYAHRW